ncbi:hypothetical protein T12_8744, partial [Trichinella patagoniensis]
LTGKTVAQAAWQLEHQHRRRSLPFGLVMKQFFTIHRPAIVAYSLQLKLFTNSNRPLDALVPTPKRTL